MKLRLALLLMSVGVLAACAYPTPTPTPSPTAVPPTPAPLATYTPVPTATRIPSTSTPTPAVISPVELDAFCNCLQDVDASAKLVLAQNWWATTADLVKDFVSASQSTVLIDGKSYTNLERYWGDPQLDAQDNTYFAHWSMALPTLAEGKHRIEIQVTLSRAVTDGFDQNKDGKPDQYGPGEEDNGWIEITLVPGLAKGSVLAGPTRMPTTTPPPVLLQGKLIFQDGLATNTNYWDEISWEENFFFQDGKFHIVLNKPGGRMSEHPESAKGGEGPTIKDFVLEVDAALVDGPDANVYGIAFRQDTEAFYSFEVSGNGRFRFGRNEGKMITLIDWTPHPAILTGKRTNALRVVAQGDTFTFFVNGTLVATARDKVLSQGGFGPIVVHEDRGGAVHAAFDNLKVWKLGTPTTPGETFAKGDVIFQDDFETNQAEWRKGQVVAKYYFQDSTYHVLYRKPGGNWLGNAWLGGEPKFKDFILEVQATQLEGSATSGYGIGFRGVEPDFYYFSVSEDRSFQVLKYTKGTWTTLIPPTTSPAIKTGNAPNILKVAAKGSTFQFFITDTFVGACTDATLPGG